MESNTIRNILEQGKPRTQEPDTSGKCFLSLPGQDVRLNYFEARFKDGSRISFAYDSLGTITYLATPPILDLDFDGNIVRLVGKGLDGKLLLGIQERRVMWVKESDSEFQDNPESEAYIEDIDVLLAGERFSDEE